MNPTDPETTTTVVAITTEPEAAPSETAPIVAVAIEAAHATAAAEAAEAEAHEATEASELAAETAIATASVTVTGLETVLQAVAAVSQQVVALSEVINSPTQTEQNAMVVDVPPETQAESQSENHEAEPRKERHGIMRLLLGRFV